MQQFSIEEMQERTLREAELSQDVLTSATHEPVILVNQSQPSYVVLSIQDYQQLIDRLTELEDQAFGQLAELALQHSSRVGSEAFVAELEQLAQLDDEVYKQLRRLLDQIPKVDRSTAQTVLDR